MSRFKTILILYFTVTAITCYAQSSSEITDYIAKYRQMALEQEQKYGVPASITLAQGILESGAGKSSLTRNANNHFGIKAFGDWSGPIYLAWDDEQQKSSFRSYQSASESYEDHAKFLMTNGRYQALFSKSVYDYRAWAIGLQKAGYATASNYAKALIGYIDAYKLYSLNGGVKLRAGKTVTITRIVDSNKLVFDKDCVMDENEVSDEESHVSNAIKRFVVEINGVRCTLLYPGETIASVAQKYDIPQDKILEYNELNNGSEMKEGDVVFLEKKKSKYRGIQDSYRVAANDTLYSIAQKFGVQMSALAKLNGLNLFSILREGDMIALQ